MHQETEIKFYIADLQRYEKMLRELGDCLQPRTLETNLRFDDPGKRLHNAGKVLRLRQDRLARLTYKGPSQRLGEVQTRQEIEITVSDFETARALLEGLGFSAYFRYEKYRSEYKLGSSLVTLDELPYGNFMEIEAETPAEIRETSRRLGLAWEKRILDSYPAIFNRLKARLDLSFDDLLFENFSGLIVSASDLGVQSGDEV